jgi:hypothetical protein
MAEQNTVTMDDGNNITTLEQPVMAVTDAEPSAELTLNEHTPAVEPLNIEEPNPKIRSKLHLYALLTALYARHFV